MNWAALRLLYVHEMRMILRSPRTIVVSLVLPAILMPLMISGSRIIQQRQTIRLDETTFEYAVTGPWADHARQLIKSYRNSPEFMRFNIQEVDVADPDKALRDGTLHFYVRTLDTNQADQAAKQAGGSPVPGLDQPQIVTGVPALQVVYLGSRQIDRAGAERMTDIMRAARRNESYSILIARGFPSHPDGILATTNDNLATESQISGSNLGRFFTVVLVVWIVAAGSIAAMDIIAGEKERGTLETLITTGAGRTEIASAKHLAICTVGIAITFMQVLYALIYIRLRVITLPPDFTIDLSAQSVLQLFILFVPLAAAIAAALLIVSAYAKTYKEAQLHFFPLFMGSLVPSLAAVIPGLKSRSIIALVPVANVSVAVREVLTGRPDHLMIGVTVTVMSLTAALLIRYSAKLLAREDIVVSTQHELSALEGGESLFQRQVVRWFAVMWAVTFAAAANIPQLSSPLPQILFNEVVIFFGASVFMIRRYRLDVRKVLGLRRLPWPIYAAALMAVPAAQVVAVAFFRIVSIFIPTPTDLVRQVAEEMTQTSLPLWVMLLFMAVLPALCEELAFRGLLLHGLRHRFHPIVQCLVIGIVFGIFHYYLFRIAPTALLGVILTAIALMTGSVLPGLVFHTANNALAILMERANISLSRLDGVTYTTAIAVFALCMHMIWRYGRESRRT